MEDSGPAAKRDHAFAKSIFFGHDAPEMCPNGQHELIEKRIVHLEIDGLSFDLSIERHAEYRHFPVEHVSCHHDGGLPLKYFLIDQVLIDDVKSLAEFFFRDGEHFDRLGEERVSEVSVESVSDSLSFCVSFFGKSKFQVFINYFFAVAYDKSRNQINQIRKKIENRKGQVGQHPKEKHSKYLLVGRSFRTGSLVTTK